MDSITSFKTPILLITFNRPEHTRAVLERIISQHPSHLYIFQDGARYDSKTDLAKCKEVRNIVSSLAEGTSTRFYTYYSDINFGCGPGPYTAISWFFQNVDKGIILEDDIVPHPLLFSYMENLLNRYANDDRIGAIMGHNLYRKYSLKNSYYFTYDTEGTLGWGTWKRVWDKVDFNVTVNPNEFDSSLMKYFHFPKIYRQREINHFCSVLNCDRHDRWDYQLEYCLKLHGYLNIKPNSCLTSHEGNDSDATHTGYSNPNYKMEVIESRFLELRHPLYVHIDILERLRLIKRTIRCIIHSK